MPPMDSADDGCRHDWQLYFDDPDAEACLWCGAERRHPTMLTASA